MADTDSTADHKTCGSCKQCLSITRFYKNKRAKDGLHQICKTCHCLVTSRYRQRNKEKVSNSTRAWQLANKDKVAAASSRHRLKKLAADPEFEKRRAKEYRKANPDIVKAIEDKKRAKRAIELGPEMKQYAAEYYEKNSEIVKERSKARYYARKEIDRPLVAQRVMRRNAKKRNASPEWGSQAEIQMFYDRAAELTKLTGIQHHVDHMVPLQSKYVCGLHVEFNLEVKTWVDNVSKSNRWWPDCPDHVIESLPKRVRQELEDRS